MPDRKRRSAVASAFIRSNRLHTGIAVLSESRVTRAKPARIEVPAFHAIMQA